MDINYSGEYTCLSKIGRPRGAKNHKDMEGLCSTMNTSNLIVQLCMKLHCQTDTAHFFEYLFKK